MLAGLAAQLFAACFGGDEARFDAFAHEVAFELSDPCQHVGHHAAMGAVEFKGHA